MHPHCECIACVSLLLPYGTDNVYWELGNLDDYTARWFDTYEYVYYMVFLSPVVKSFAAAHLRLLGSGGLYRCTSFVTYFVAIFWFV